VADPWSVTEAVSFEAVTEVAEWWRVAEVPFSTLTLTTD
jgi:hypothetical protein